MSKISPWKIVAALGIIAIFAGGPPLLEKTQKTRVSVYSPVDVEGYGKASFFISVSYCEGDRIQLKDLFYTSQGGLVFREISAWRPGECKEK